MKFDSKQILKNVRELGFEEAWLRALQYIPSSGRGLPLKGSGKRHPVSELAEKIRATFLSMGFDEVLLPTIVEEEDVYRQYGPEAPIILDRCYYLAALPRPDIGLSRDKCDRIRALGIPLDEDGIEAIQQLLRDYKRGKVDADDLVERFMLNLKTTDSNAMRVLREVFPEFASLKPAPSSMVLRSHLTSAWFDTLSVLQHRMSHPLKLFSIGMRYRREQSEDATHLRTHLGASCVILDEEVTLEDGKRVTETLFKNLGFEQLKFVQKKTTSKYYAPQTEHEVFVNSLRLGKWIEVADLGFYSPIALSNYDIEFPVLNIGLGIERLGMLVTATRDIRALVYPQFYGEWILTDAELAHMIRISEEPATDDGKKVYEAVVAKAKAEALRPSPCEVVAYRGRLLDKEVEVTLYETDPNTKLLGNAAFNTVYVYDGNILGIPPVGLDDVKEVCVAREKGVSTGITYLEAVVAKAVAQLEFEAANGGVRDVNIRVRVAKSPGDVNIKISNVAIRYITGKHKKVVVKGPTFIGIRGRFLHG
ncbi:MAG: O-phosphoserine--tRNA ligase [Candidatus Bathyarchaeia archaeon]